MDMKYHEFWNNITGIVIAVCLIIMIIVVCVLIIASIKKVIMETIEDYYERKYEQIEAEEPKDEMNNNNIINIKNYL